MSQYKASTAVGVQWRKSSYSNAGNECVEVTRTNAVCAVRDSKNPDGGQLVFGASTWKAFVAAVKSGIYDQ